MGGSSPALDTIGGGESPAGSGFGSSRWRIRLLIPVLVIAALWMVVVPLLDHLVKYDDPIKPGQELLLAPGITFTPTPGWNLEAGLRTTDRTRTHAPGAPARLVFDTIELNVGTTPFHGSPADLLKEIERESLVFGKETLTATGETLTVPAGGSEPDGVAEHYTSPDGQGLTAAFVFDQTGVSVSVVGSSAQMDAEGDRIGEMLTSFSYDPKAATRSGQDK